jgi:hypothetical protein
MQEQRLTVNRFASNKTTTLSNIAIDHKWECFGLEDEHRDVKVAGDTRIPSGIYTVGVRAVGGFHANYTNRFPDFHQGMLQVMDVPNFKYVLLHVGNDDDDTAGCLCMGTNAVTGGRWRVPNSVTAYKRLYCKVIEAALAGKLTIEYWDNDL